MENERKNYIEDFVKKLCSNKKRLTAFLLSCLCVLFSVPYMLNGYGSGIMIIYMMCITASACANIVYVVNVEGKNKYASDILVIGILVAVAGILLRTFQLGILFSIGYFIGYLLFLAVLVMLALKHIKNSGKTKLLLILLAVAVAYSLFEGFSVSTASIFGRFAWGYYRFAEALLFASYIFIVLINSSDFESFGDSVGKYKYQIPSLKILLLVFAFIAVISVSIGAISKLGDEKTVSVTKTEKSEISDTKKSTVTKSSGTVTSNKEDKSHEEKIKEIMAGETVSTEKYDFTVNRVEFSYRVEPDTPPSWYTYYDAPDNEVYIYLNASVKNKQKNSVECDEIYSVTADYDDGYTYKGFNIADDTDGDFTYANITSVEPLQTLGVHNLTACPKEVETSDKPLFLIITLKDGTKLKYTIR